MASILEAVAFFAFGELSQQLMVLRRWQAEPDIRPFVNDYLAVARKHYASSTEESIRKISRFARMPTSPKSSPLNSPSIPHPASSPLPLMPGKTTKLTNKKRSRSSVTSTASRTASEIKVSKRSKLLRALEAANKTLSAVESDLGGLDAVIA